MIVAANAVLLHVLIGRLTFFSLRKENLPEGVLFSEDDGIISLQDGCVIEKICNDGLFPVTSYITDNT